MLELTRIPMTATFADGEILRKNISSAWLANNQAEESMLATLSYLKGKKCISVEIAPTEAQVAFGAA